MKKGITFNFDGRGQIFHPLCSIMLVIPQHIVLQRWLRKRRYFHRQLKEFCSNNEHRKQLVSRLVEYWAHEKFFQEMSQRGGCKEVRDWSRITAPALRAKIEALALTPVELYEANKLVALATPELVLDSLGVPEEHMLKIYHDFKRGDFFWPFTTTNPNKKLAA